MRPQTVISIHGGLGNQLFQLGLAESLVNLSDVSILPWKSNCRVDETGNMWISHYELSKKFIKEFSFGDYFFNSYSQFCHKILIRTSKSKIAGLFFKVAHVVLTKWPRLFGIGIITNLNVGEFECPKLLRRNYIVAYFQTHKALEFIGQSIAKENKIKFPQPYRTKKPDSKILVVHIRRTDYKDNPDIGLLPGEYYIKALGLISTQFAWDEIWLFSDDLDEAVELIPQELHEKIRLIRSNHLTPIEVLAQMADGDAYILSNSTFGWWAANLSLRKPALVVVPDIWFKNLPEPQGLIPPDWIRVRA